VPVNIAVSGQGLVYKLRSTDVALRSTFGRPVLSGADVGHYATDCGGRVSIGRRGGGGQLGNVIKLGVGTGEIVVGLGRKSRRLEDVSEGFFFGMLATQDPRGEIGQELSLL